MMWGWGRKVTDLQTEVTYLYIQGACVTASLPVPRITCCQDHPNCPLTFWGPILPSLVQFPAITGFNISQCKLNNINESRLQRPSSVRRRSCPGLCQLIRPPQSLFWCTGTPRPLRCSFYLISNLTYSIIQCWRFSKLHTVLRFTYIAIEAIK